jgi:L-aminopeptidase/D-esterase-like protein
MVTNSIVDVPGFLVGQVDDPKGMTGCSVVLAPPGTAGGLDQRGGAAGSRQLDPLGPLHIVEEVHAVLLAGGSAFGLEAATGVARWLEEHDIGFDVGVARVPIVPTAILFDLGLGEGRVRPDAAMGYASCRAASDKAPRQGNAGAGMGATAGKLLGPQWGMKSGIGSVSRDLGNGLVVGALVAANPLGNVVDPASGAVLAGVRDPAGQGFADLGQVLRQRLEAGVPRFGPAENTVIGVVATNGTLTKRDCSRVAQMAQDGVARAVRPAHTMFDGDTLFVLASGERPVDPTVIGAVAADLVAEAIVRAVKHATGAAGFPAWRDLAPAARMEA